MKKLNGKGPGRRSMRRLILYAMSFCILLFLIVGLAGLYFLSNSYYAEFAENQNELLESYYHYIDKCMEDATRTSLRIIASEAVQQGLHDIMTSSGTKLAQAKTDLHDAVVASVAEVSGYGYIRSVIVSDCHGAIYSFGGIPQNARLQEAIQQLIEQTDDSGKGKWFALDWEGQPYLVLGRAIRETKNLSLNLLGYEMILVQFERLARQAEPADSAFADSLETYLDGTRFYRGPQCPEESVGLDVGAAWKILSLNGTRYFVSSASFLDGRLTLVSYVNYSRLTSLLQDAGRNLLFLFLLLILFSAAFFQLVTKRVFRHLEMLTEAVKTAPAGDFRVTLSPDILQAEDEVGILAKQFQHLMNQIDDLIHRELEGKLQAARARCRMLQAQIHPHFLYNTLETIYALSERGGNREVSRITMSLSRLVRASFRDSMYATLEQEISLVREYLAIYRIRFGSRLSAKIDYDPDDDGLPLPRMTLQPLVENSVRYGLMKKLDHGVIRLRVRHTGGLLKISLFDNGIGFSPEQLEIYNHLQPDDGLNMHGYRNVVFRLIYTYGDRASYRLRSREGQWTNLSLTIPDRLPDASLPEGEGNDVQSAARG
ncbi:MAG: histidine kinase [Clostridia bacterium]|nr:histidine kinase [Clostridia bacterium]